MTKIYDTIIIGTGPAGLTAGLYCAQAGLSVIALESTNPGGQLINIEKIENYMGFVEGIDGPGLGQTMVLQAMKYGLSLQLESVSRVKFDSKIKIVQGASSEYRGKTVIVATGGKPRKLNIPGESKFIGKGIIYCGMCEGNAFKDKAIAVIGGGDAGITEALYLSRIASRVVIIETASKLNARALLRSRIADAPNIDVICGRRPKEILGDEIVSAIRLEGNGEPNKIDVDGVLVHVGWEPETSFLKEFLDLDAEGRIVVNEKLETSETGVYAVGDVREGSLRQIGGAVGDGIIAATEAIKYIFESDYS